MQPKARCDRLQSGNRSINQRPRLLSMNETIRLTLDAPNQWPWLVLAAIAAPLIFTAWKFRIYPSRGWLALLGVSLVASVMTIFFPNFLVVAAVVDVALLLVAGTDLALLYAMTHRGIEAKRTLPRTCSLGVPIESEVILENRSGMRLRGELRDDLPAHFTSVPEFHELNLAPLGVMSAKRKLIPGRRGAFKLSHVYLMFSSLCRLWKRHMVLSVEDPLNVYPDMKQLADYALLRGRTD